ncbi:MULTISPECIES: hypothetical protein [unclassified Cryobacterium]|uniref:hypothetical protein n=1 Tax=unclassified Cryobacterium TaxID=2649013 RepID=UPI00106B04F9|nr:MULTISPECIES: hypothetical protein [unclassified Cryobacterium]TFC53044.1 hypothetical protein E3O68_12825 [Cryobacterium sp. TMB3-1-2]TFC58757.1 hypothetical protein E3O60_11155 [Cryobacterium sp. TMB1-7]TFC69461.1 hypothetical protein E3T21_12235 [Cryobacterium sp. TMB3-15]TFC77530.1 hypothetical protein E3T22_05830 [Cryobacterium sp. TMB3-10]TFC89174.1 hypothetical protein E3T19_08940 [Cryobacterium sp. TMT4-31]
MNVHAAESRGDADPDLRPEPGRTEPFSRLLWADIAETRTAIDALPFIAELGDGSLSAGHFAYYLAQDALYLAAYSRVLAQASVLAPTPAEREFWATGAANCIEVELELHRTWLTGHDTRPAPGPVTRSYVDHLVAVSAAGNYAVLLAAVLPCYWLYADVGERLHAGFTASRRDAAHPYADWLETYADEGFAAATRQAILLTDTAAATATAVDRALMRAVFARSAALELLFFDAPRLHAPG